jgi:dTDP-4-amino-4,6-dideoxygalactose transaminase
MIPLIKPCVGEEELLKIKEVLESGYLTEGAYTEEFEKKFAKYVGTKYAVAVCNATVGLEMVLRCIGINRNDEVIVPDFTHPATADAVYLVGGQCVLVDVDLKSRNTTHDFVKSAISNNTKAAIPVSEFGNPLDEDIYELKDEIFILEDAAPSIGAEIRGKKVGSFADATVF